VFRTILRTDRDYIPRLELIDGLCDGDSVISVRREIYFEIPFR
jgi:hypothetical protein